MGNAMDLASWQDRFDGLARWHGVPGASLAVLADEQVQALATGVLHMGTGVEAALTTWMGNARPPSTSS
jgi:hypothetical protein